MRQRHTKYGKTTNNEFGTEKKQTNQSIMHVKKSKTDAVAMR
jgi:hypothetical protein